MIYSKATAQLRNHQVRSQTSTQTNPDLKYRPDSTQPPAPAALTDAILVPERDAELHLFRARRTVLRDLLKLSTALDDRVVDLSETLLQRFCSNLSRYLSVSHHRAFQARKIQTARYLALAGTSREIMAFCDHFTNLPAPTGDALLSVREQLGQLAMTLETRFELEDDLISNDRYAVAH